MNTKISNFFYNFRILLTAICCLAGITIFFINSNTLCNMVVKAFHLKVAPAFIGGEIVADFFDDTEDDAGSGILRYPANSEFTEGALDLVRYTVHQPVYNAQWQSYPDYWQLDMEFRAEASDVRNIMIYINLDTSKNEKLSPLETSDEPLFSPAENVTFDPNIPWNYAVWISGFEGKVYDSNKNLICNAELIVLNNGKTLKVRIPLKDKGLQRVYFAPKTYHYVLVGAYSKYDLGGFMPIEKRRSNSRGGTIKSKDFNLLIPKVYDLLGDNSQLASWDGNDLTKASIKPVCAKMEKIKSNKDDNSGFIQQVYSALSQPDENQQSQGQYFGFESLDEALENFEEQMQKNPEDALAVVHYGSCLAMKGGQSSVIQAVTYVNKAFEYLDKAVQMESSEEDRFEILMNRASVCKSVPESVFGKAITGAQDFIELSKIQRKRMSSEEITDMTYEKNVLAYLYICASQCYEAAGKQTEAEIMLQEAKKALE